MLTEFYKLNLSVFDLFYEKSINEKKRNIKLIKKIFIYTD